MQPYPTDRRSTTRDASGSRRTRLRLRELCDEVLASYRIATDRTPITARKRAEATALLRHVTPTLRG